jgi:two-component system, OmpR family, response regulator RpaA
MEKKVYTVAEAARAFGRSEDEIRDAVRSGMLPGEMVHNVGDYLIKAEDLEHFLRATKSPVTAKEKFRVLIVDDEVNFANVVKLELSRDPRMEVRYASWGADGVRTADEFKPDLCLIDFMLPDVTGEDVLRSIRSLQSNRASKVVVYSAHTREAITQHPDLEERLKKLGADEFMSKSSGLRALIIKVYALLGIQTNTKVVRKPGPAL